MQSVEENVFNDKKCGGGGDDDGDEIGRFGKKLGTGVEVSEIRKLG